MILRTFIALETPQEHRDALSGYLHRWSRSYPQGINWVKPANLHQTLIFLGDTDTRHLSSIKQIISASLSDVHPFVLQLSGFELIPSVQPRIVWAKATSETTEIYAFVSALGRKLREQNLQFDAKPLKLHITMGRIKSPQAVSTEREFLSSGLPVESAKYDTITFYQSTLRADGPIYTPIETYKI